MDPLYTTLPLVLISCGITAFFSHAFGFSKGKRFGFRQGVDIQKNHPELAQSMISKNGHYR